VGAVGCAWWCVCGVVLGGVVILGSFGCWGCCCWFLVVCGGVGGWGVGGGGWGGRFVLAARTCRGVRILSSSESRARVRLFSGRGPNSARPVLLHFLGRRFGALGQGSFPFAPSPLPRRSDPRRRTPRFHRALSNANAGSRDLRPSTSIMSTGNAASRTPSSTSPMQRPGSFPRRSSRPQTRLGDYIIARQTRKSRESS